MDGVDAKRASSIRSEQIPRGGAFVRIPFKVTSLEQTGTAESRPIRSSAVAVLAHRYPYPDTTARLPTLDLDALQDSRTPPGTLASQENKENEGRERERERALSFAWIDSRRFVPRIETSVILSSLISSNSEMFDNLADTESGVFFEDSGVNMSLLNVLRRMYEISKCEEK